MTSGIRRFRFYHATIRTRRGDGFDVKPELEPWLAEWEGKRIVVLASWALRKDDGGPYLPGEWAMGIERRAELRCPITWMASGDLANLVPLSAEETARHLQGEELPPLLGQPSVPPEQLTARLLERIPRGSDPCVLARLGVLEQLPDWVSEDAVSVPVMRHEDGCLVFTVRAPVTAEMLRDAFYRSRSIPPQVGVDVVVE